MGEYIDVGEIDDIPKGKMKAFEVNHTRIVVINGDDGIYALADECSHDYAPISSGHVRRGEVVCPRHGARFDIRTGEVKAPPAVVGIDTYPTRVENGRILVKVE
ncbi:MAG: non-heme iron oxygenase ferredoxin subunit [Candidatus Zixiibacteriota bacterium]